MMLANRVGPDQAAAQDTERDRGRKAGRFARI